MTVQSGTEELALVRYGELTLKGKNRPEFEKRLADNVRAACRPLSPVRIERRWDRMLVVPERAHAEVFAALQRVFGISSISPAHRAEATPDAIAEVARRALADAMLEVPPERRITFRVKAKRSDKSFPLHSNELERHVAEAVMPPYPNLDVQLGRPELTLGIEVRSEGAYVFARRLPGPGGLPVGCLGRALCLLSGGIDSPVAAWMAMKRGAAVNFISFHSYPYIGESSVRKLEKLVRVLERWQPHGRLYVLPFTEIQEAIRDHCPSSYRTVLYRRFMQRLASRVAERDGSQMLITGESLGQVASQTMENMTCIEDASELPVLRPLVCFDKQETIELAHKIGSYDVSILPEPDCCTVFQPPKAIIRGRLSACHAAEDALDLEGLAARALEGVRVIDVDRR